MFENLQCLDFVMVCNNVCSSLCWLDLVQTLKTMKMILSFGEISKSKYIYIYIQTKLKLLAHITMSHIVSKGHTGVAFHFIYFA